MGSNPLQSFEPHYRLHYSSEYRKFFGKSTAFRFTECQIFRIPNNFGHYRLGITVKARTNSINRNRYKRAIREFFRKYAREFGPYDFNVVIPFGRKLDYLSCKKLKLCLEREVGRELLARR